MSLNPQQAAAALDVDRHVLVSAGAGTGKTQCVVGRILYQLGEEVAGKRIPPDRRIGLGQLAAITFTNMAAADLQRKLRQALRAAGRVEEAVQVDTARIGTIHSFCGQVLREFALELPRSPGLYALDEAEAIDLAADAAREALLEAVEHEPGEDLSRLLEAFAVEKVVGWTATLAGDSARLSACEQDLEANALERVILRLARRTLDLMRKRLNERSALDFDTMITQVRDLLRDRDDVRRALQRRIRLLVIDEFQDVDPAQKAIAWLLGEPGSCTGTRTRLMLVGDPKQSIFRFRRADVTVWTGVQRAFENGAGAVHTLTENYRSRRPILALVDAIIGPALDTPVDPAGGRADYEVRAQPLTATAANDVTDPCVEVLALPPVNGKARFGESARSLEVVAVARRVRELVEEGYRPGDIAILIPAWGGVAAYASALRRQGIASWTLRNEGYWERREVLDCLVALQAALDPLDDLALFGFLRSPMVGVRDDTLLDIARQCRTPYWHRIAQVECDESRLLAFGAGLIQRAAALRDRIPHDELLQELLEASGYLGYLRLLGEDGRQAEANVWKLIRLLRGWRELVLADILRMIAEVRERPEGTREGDAPLESREDAVTISSIHGAKGLEWPVVIWADVTRGPAALDYFFIAGRNAVRLRAPEVDHWKDDPRFVALRRAEELEGLAERKRLWYVAATRAQKRLIIAGVPTGELTARHEFTAAALVRGLGDLSGTVAYRDHTGAELAALIRMAEAGKDATAGHPLDDQPPVLSAESLALLPDRWPVPVGPPRHSASELLTFARCQRKHWFAYVAGLREPPIDRTTPDFLDAVTRGQIVHDVLERLREADELDQLLEDAIGRWDPDAPPPEASSGARYRSHLRTEIDLVAGHPAWASLAGAAGARRELAFVRLLPGERWIQGRLDLIGPDGDGQLRALDVKTGKVAVGAAEARAAAYAPQRDAYVGAVEAISGRDMAEFGFLFSRAATYVGTPITPALRAGAAGSVMAAMDAVEGGGRDMTANPVECRFCGYRKAGWCEGVKR